MFTRALRRHVTPGDVSLSPSIPLLRNGRADLRRRDLSIDHNGAALWPLGARRTAQRGRAIWPPKTSTFVAVLRLTGIDAPCMAFETQVEKVLLPELKCGDIVIMYNVSRHNGPKGRDLIKAAGAQLRFLPPYSPDFNPIKNAFSKLKAHLRKAAERTVDTLWSAGRIRPLHTKRMQKLLHCSRVRYDRIPL